MSVSHKMNAVLCYASQNDMPVTSCKLYAANHPQIWITVNFFSPSFFLVLPLSVVFLIRFWQSNGRIVTYSDGHLKEQIQIVSRK